MTEPENIVLRQLAELRAEVKSYYDQMDTRLARIEDMVRGLASIMAGIAGRLEGIETRLARLERERTS